MSAVAGGGPYHGIRVADFTELLPGPFFTQAMAELGAEVIKLERPPAGDGLRASSPGLFTLVNRGKRSLTVDLKDEAGRARALDTVAACDVMVEGFRPGVMERLGLGYEAVRARRPDIVYVSMSGYGQTGPLRNAPGHDLNYMAVAGVTSLSGEAGGPPAHTFGLPAADLAGALYALAATGAALFQRERTGKGQWVDLSITDCMAHWVNARRGPFNHGAVTDLAEQRRLATGRPAYGVFACRDGAISIAALESHFYERLADALALGPFAAAQYRKLAARRRDTAQINAAIATAVAPMSRADALALLQAADVPVSPVLTVDEAAASDHFAARGLIVDTEVGPATPFPIRLAGMAPMPPAAPALDEAAQDLATEGLAP